MPLWLALSVVVGIFIGTFFANRFNGNRLSIINSGSNKLTDLLHIIDDQYVDTVNMNDLVETAMPQILSELDPHSVYISEKDVRQANDDLKGSFFGVGIEFTIRQDTIHVQNVIGNGPAERAGLLAGDKIVEVDGKPFVGKEVTNEVAMRALKGEKDTKVQVGVLRYKEKKVKRFTITRGEIPMKSVTATYMLNDDTGYIKIKNWGEKTYPELLIALAQFHDGNIDRSQYKEGGWNEHDDAYLFLVSQNCQGLSVAFQESWFWPDWFHSSSNAGILIIYNEDGIQEIDPRMQICQYKLDESTEKLLTFDEMAECAAEYLKGRGGESTSYQITKAKLYVMHGFSEKFADQTIEPHWAFYVIENDNGKTREFILHMNAITGEYEAK